ncbi:glycosyltransferase family 8 protein [Tepidamorphus sp. 3E244]|uniref:glycosyltransferase family 8 protein n=1 Tax=Tepidamorphus sp. 3E244 TaxID=3385498 RepID=UPI0038FCD1FF
MDRDIRDVCLVSLADRRFMPHVSVLIASLAQSESKYPFFLLQSFLATGEQKILRDFGASLDIEVEILTADRNSLNRFQQCGDWPECNWMKFFIPELIPERFERVIFLDSDIVVTKSLAGLAELDLGGAAVGAVPDKQNDNPRRKARLGMPVDATYFNMGVCLIDLAQWRQLDFGQTAARFAADQPEKISFIDQCAINATGWQHVVPIPGTWNQMVNYIACGSELPHVIHYCGFKPWDDVKVPAREFYLARRKDTPFPIDNWKLADVEMPWLRRRDAILNRIDSVLRPDVIPTKKRPVQRFNRKRYQEFWKAFECDLPHSRKSDVE